MSNPTTKVATFNGSLDGFTGVEPIRYSSGLWLEEGKTNYVTNPVGTTYLAACNTLLQACGYYTLSCLPDGRLFSMPTPRPPVVHQLCVKATPVPSNPLVCLGLPFRLPGGWL